MNEYPNDGTDSEKLDSKFVKSLRNNQSISVFRVGNGITDSRIAAALAATRMHLGPINYVLFDGSECVAIQCDGETPDAGVNAAHYDIQNVGDAGIIELADIMVRGSAVELTKNQVYDEVMRSIENGYMNESDVRFKLDL